MNSVFEVNELLEAADELLTEVWPTHQTDAAWRLRLIVIKLQALDTLKVTEESYVSVAA